MEEEKQKHAGMQEKKTIREVNPSIHEMPKYDPDADILNLIYTIPSWISSIDRVEKNTDFKRTTYQSNQKLASQIASLRGTLERVEFRLKGVM